MISNVFFVALMLGAAFCAFRISATDMRRRIIPDAYLFPLMIIAMLVLAFFGDRWVCTMSDAAIGAALGYALGAIVGIVFERIQHARGADNQTPIGFGDIKLLAAGGLWLGATGLAWALVVACVFGIIWARAKKMRFIPFAPFFVAGAILTLIGMFFLL